MYIKLMTYMTDLPMTYYNDKYSILQINAVCI